MSRRLPSTLFTASLGIVLSALGLLPGLAGAAVVVTDATAFVIAIDANDAVSVDCSGGFVRVTDDGTPTAYTTACAAVTSLNVTATGAFDNTVDLSGMTAAAYTQLATAAQAVSLSGGGGVDTLTGSELSDVIKGGAGNDVMSGGAGADVFTWVPGDGSDTIQGGAGNDVLGFLGAAGAEAFALTADGAGFDFTRDVGNIVMDLEGVEGLELSAGGGNNSVTLNDLTGVADLVSVFLVMGDGDDTVNASAQLNPAVLLEVLASTGNDALIGSPGADALHGEEGNDSISGLGGIDLVDGGDGDDSLNGGPGNETQLGGAGNDIFVWNPGDGSDTLVGGTGTDLMFFNGSAGNEVFTLGGEGAGFRFTRDLGNIVMNATEVERIRLNALGGDDFATVNDLTGVANLDTITFFMGDGNDAATAAAQANASIDFLVNGGTGNDALTGSPNADVFAGSDGNDTIAGLAGVDLMDGGGGDDAITGGPGSEPNQQGGDGDDTFIWNPGDGSDGLVGGADVDTMLFNGSGGNEVFAATAQGAGFRFTRDLGNIVMDATGVEAITLNALGGNDSATVNDLTGVADLNTITFFMGDGDDTGSASAQTNAVISFLSSGGTGNDTLTGSPNADVIGGGDGNDTILGLAGVDLMDGGGGDDTITGGPGSEPNQTGGDGNDTFIWNPGDGSDGLVGGAGIDTMVFNGSAGNEMFATIAQGADFRFTRDLGNIVMDATGIEAITLNALAGDDRVTTVPLAGTSQNLIGGTQTTADVLVIDALGGCVVASGSGTVTIAGAQPITFSEFEQVNITNQCVAAVDIPTLGPLAMAALAAFLALAGLVLMRSRS